MSVMNSQRQEWKDFLDSLSDFDDIPVIIEDLGDIGNEVMRRLGALEGASGKVGICIVLGTVSAMPDTKAEFGPVLKMTHVVRVIENVEINRDSAMNGTLLTYSDIIEKIVGYTHARFTPLSGACQFMLEAPGIQEIDTRFLQHVPIGPGKDAFFSCIGLFTNALDPVETPVISVDGNGEVTLTCATPGAAIFFTLNGKKPSPTKTLYVAPFTPPAGTTINARGWLAGFYASEISTIIT